MRCISLFATFVVLLAGAGRAHATPPGTNGQIAFVDGGDIWVMNPDGGGRTQLTSGPETDYGPDWSPDGTRIAFTRFTSGSGYSLHVMSADGGNRESIAAAGSDFFGPSWSPDGARIAYSAQTPPSLASRLWTVNADGSNPTPLPVAGPPLESEFAPAWSPDGTEIAFIAEYCSGEACQGPLPYYIGVVPAGGGVHQSLEDGFPLDWSPDGAYLLQSLFGDEIYRLLRANPANDQQLISSGPHDVASYSPDGVKIAVDEPLTTGQVVVMNADGSNPTPIGSGGQPDWQAIPAPAAKNRAKACKAERERLGEAAFAARYGGGANAHGKCVSQKP